MLLFFLTNGCKINLYKFWNILGKKLWLMNIKVWLSQPISITRSLRFYEETELIFVQHFENVKNSVSYY